MIYFKNYKNGSILDIGSGSGENGEIFQKRFPKIIWQISVPDLLHRKSRISWIEYEELNKKMPRPLELDVENISWSILIKLAHSLQGIVSINMIYISQSICTIVLFKGGRKIT